MIDNAELERRLERLGRPRVLIVGDLIMDRYVIGDVARISPEAPIPVLAARTSELRLGGAGNVAANLRALGAETALIGVLGDDDDGRRMREALSARGIDTGLLIQDPARPTTTKTRIVAHAQQVVRADREVRGDVAGAAFDRLRAAIEDALARSEALVVSDYGKGVVHPGTLEVALATARARRIPVCVDPKESHIDAYRGVTILTPNQHEAGYVQGRRVVDQASLEEVGWGLQRRLDADAVLVTRGGEGMSLFERGGRCTYLPTVAREVYDVTGAGDTVAGVVGLALAAGAAFPDACRIANHAAGVVVAEVGTATCDPAALLASLEDRRR